MAQLISAYMASSKPLVRAMSERGRLIRCRTFWARRSGRQQEILFFGDDAREGVCISAWRGQLSPK